MTENLLNERIKFNERIELVLKNAGLEQFHEAIQGFSQSTQTAPVIDMLQSRHDLLYTRLFNS